MFRSLPWFRWVPMLFGGLVVLLGVALWIFWGWYQGELQPVSIEEESTRFVISPNESWDTVIDRLEQKELIRSASAFSLLVKLEKADTYKAGPYNLSPHMTSGEILEILIAGQTNEVFFRINEGFRTTQIVEKISDANIFTKTEIQEALDPELYEFSFLEKLPSGLDEPMEGYLFPDTYLIPVDAKPQDFINQVLENFAKKLEPYDKEISTSNYSLHELITLASIVEREATRQKDRDMIAGVFWNRLEEGMMLGADPTVLYILGDWKAPITTDALAIDSPYNTRKVRGLPPGPICNPSESSIKAVLSPSDHDYLYFLAKDGVNYFSNTYDEHKKKKQELQVY